MRTPTPSGLRSALRAAHGLVAQYTSPPSVAQSPTVDADPVHAVIRIGVDECWCAHCGGVMHMGGRNEAFARDELLGACCRNPKPVPAVTVLKQWEFLQ